MARWLAAEAELVELGELGDEMSAEQTAASIELITGADWAGVRERPRSPTPSEEASGTTVVEADPSTSAGSATSLPAEVPESTTTTAAPQPAC